MILARIIAPYSDKFMQYLHTRIHCDIHWVGPTWRITRAEQSGHMLFVTLTSQDEEHMILEHPMQCYRRHKRADLRMYKDRGFWEIVSHPSITDELLEDYCECGSPYRLCRMLKLPDLVTL